MYELSLELAKRIGARNIGISLTKKYKVNTFEIEDENFDGFNLSNIRGTISVTMVKGVKVDHFSVSENKKNLADYLIKRYKNG